MFKNEICNLKYVTFMFVLDSNAQVGFDIDKLKFDLEAISKLIISEEFRCSFIAKQAFNILKVKSTFK